MGFEYSGMSEHYKRDRMVSKGLIVFADKMTVRQETFIRESLNNPIKRKIINVYCTELKKSWCDLTFSQASCLIGRLTKIY